MYCISKVERAVLKQMYPKGCRVVLEYMEDEPYTKLEPGDLGTVQFIDDSGSIHVSWDRGSSLGLVYRVDRCTCLMTKEQMDEILVTFRKRPFENIEKMKNWLEGKLQSVFPKMKFCSLLHNDIEIDFGCSAFQIDKLRLRVEYTQDVQKHIFVIKAELGSGKEIKKTNSAKVERRK